LIIIHNNATDFDHACQREDDRICYNKRAYYRGNKCRQTDGLLVSFGYLEVAYKIRGDKFIIKTIKIKKWKKKIVICVKKEI